MIKNVIHTIWNHRVFLSVALSETGVVRGARVRALWIVLLIFSLLATGAGLSMMSDLSRARLAAAVSGNEDLQRYVEQITTLEQQRSHQNKQLEVVAQELGVLQARLDRFDVIGEKLFNDEMFSEHFKDDARIAGQGGPTEIPFTETLSLKDVSTQLEALMGRADRAEAALETGLALSLRKSGHAGSMPYLWPVVHKRTFRSSLFGWRKDPFRKKRSFHSGMDIAAAWNAPIVAAGDGVIIFSGYRYRYGMVVEIRHTNGFTSRYAHMKAATVKNGDTVQAGALVGLMGSTGRSTGPHLHFEVLKNDEKIDPYPFVRETRQYAKQLGREGKGESLVAAWKETLAAVK